MSRMVAVSRQRTQKLCWPNGRIQARSQKLCQGRSLCALAARIGQRCCFTPGMFKQGHRDCSRFPWDRDRLSPCTVTPLCQTLLKTLAKYASCCVRPARLAPALVSYWFGSLREAILARRKDRQAWPHISCDLMLKERRAAGCYSSSSTVCDRVCYAVSMFFLKN